MRLIGIAGYSGSGKTTLIKKLIPLLKAKGLRVATIKHAHHKFDVDKPGKDSYEHRAAGASQVLIASANRWALMSENKTPEEPSLPFLLERLNDVDFVLVEGFKSWPHPKIEVTREGGTERLSEEVPNIVAVANDTDAAFSINTPEAWINELIDLAVTKDEVKW